MFGMGGTEIGIILVIALLLFGPSQLPKLVKGMAESLREVKNAMKDEDKPQETKKEG